MSVAKRDLEDNRKVTTHRLIEMKQRGEKISMLTAYDYSMAQLIDQAGMDVILVGDSASNVMAGNVTTLPITLDQMIYHGKSVMKAVKRALVVVDLPFGTYQGNSKEALASAIRVMKETHADCIKLEGGSEIRESIERILCAGIPVMGHLGLTPQSINKFGTYTVRAREEAEAKKLIADAHLLEEIGCFDLPVGPDGDYGNYSITPWALGISYGSTQKDAAWALINWMASSEMQQDAQSNGSSAARTSVWEVEGLSSWPQEFQDLAAEVGNKAYGTDRPYMINVASARDVIGQVIVTAIEGGDVQAAADTANADFQKLLDEEK